MDSYTETFGAWQGYARLDATSGATALLPAAARVDATAASFAATTDAVVTTDVVFTGLGQPKVMRNHKSITRPGSPPRGRHR